MEKQYKKVIKKVGPSFERNDERGYFAEVVNEGPWETIIQGVMKKGAVMGNHYHRECRAFLYIVTGKAEVHIKYLIDGSENSVILNQAEGLYFLPFDMHSVTYLEETRFMLLKSYRFDSKNPDIYMC